MGSSDVAGRVKGARPESIRRFQAGGVIPAHPLALDAGRRLNERRQRALSRYYADAGAIGLAVAVHTTQFAIHEPRRGLLQPVLALAAEVRAEAGRQDLILVAGVCGPTKQAVAEAELAATLGYDMCLLIPYGIGAASESDLLERAAAVGEVLPVIGFYLQDAVGGRQLSRGFWRALAEQPSTVGIKIAPFDRYRTLDVVGGVADSGRAGEVALYTGNDDAIVNDLVTTFPGTKDSGPLRIIGGLLGQWSVWTKESVRIQDLAVRARNGDNLALREILEIGPALTDANAALFDVAGGFRGSVPGIHEALRRVGLLENILCLDAEESLSHGQLAEIDRIWSAYPTLRDDEFVAENLDSWLS
jgi:dihydrodipicolinate synthase/N-acetylneuraminate lyase